MADQLDRQITASEVATYVVCPEAWRLKRIHRLRKRPEEKERVSRQLRGAWLAEQDFSARLRRYAKIAYLLLVLVVITIFLLDQNRIAKVRSRPAASPSPAPVPAAGQDSEHP